MVLVVAGDRQFLALTPGWVGVISKNCRSFLCHLRYVSVYHTHTHTYIHSHRNTRTHKHAALNKEEKLSQWLRNVQLLLFFGMLQRVSWKYHITYIYGLYIGYIYRMYEYIHAGCIMPYSTHTHTHSCEHTGKSHFILI